jgi:tRNA(Ile)-lysidine synthase
MWSAADGFPRQAQIPKRIGMSPAPPLNAIERFRRAADALRDQGRLALAVSGGPDSLALLLLAAAAFPGEVEAATVDHGLRVASGEEASFVADLCRGLGVPHEILRAEVDRGRASLQRAAREARYGALGQWLAARSIRTLATAHHVDDQAETLVMRLIRGAGIGGLAGIRTKGILPMAGSEAIVVRPLLGWRRAELRAIVEAAGVKPIDDPSNADPRFDRARIRQQLARNDWIEPVALARSAAALAEADAALDWAAQRLEEERVDAQQDRLALRPDGIPPELKRRLLLRLLARLRPEAVPRGDEIGRLIDKLETGGTATLAGVKCTGGETWLFEREPGRRG